MLIVVKQNSDGSVDLLGKQGATWKLTLSLTDNSDNPIDLTGYIVRGQVRKSYQSSIAYNFICYITDAENGKLVISMPASLTASIPSADDKNPKAPDNTYVYDIEIESRDGVVTRILEGNLYIDPEVTK
jgi:hypothetical protein